MHSSRNVRWFALAAALLLMALPLRAADETNPSVLIVATRGTWGGMVDLDWLREIHGQGFEPDWLERYTDLSWERIRNYNVLVIFGCPGAEGEGNHIFPPRGPQQKEYLALMERFLQQGGGIFCMIYTHNADHGIRPMLDPWGVRLPFETYRETDEGKIRRFPRMRGLEQASLTRQILEAPVTAGVHRLWLPYNRAYNGSWSSPLALSDAWQVIVTGSETSETVPVDTSAITMPPPADPLVREGGVKQPPLMAIRDYGAGRLFICSQWPQFSLGQGTQWLYNRRCLSRGFDGLDSDMERLILNTFRWLAEPSLKTGQVGGYVTTPDRLQAPNEREEAFKGYEERHHPDKRLDPATGIPPRKIFRGMLGAQTAYSSGRGTVAEYAAAARAAGLDFLIFMEQFSSFSEAKLRQLEADCQANSGPDLLLLPGFTMDSNTGNHLFFYGPPPLTWPRPECLTGPDRHLLNIQYQNEQGDYQMRPVVLDWILSHNQDRNVGYYHFDDPAAMQMPDLKLYSAAALRFYRDGALVEDATDAFLTTAQGTIPPTPVSVNLVRAPAELTREVDAGHALIYAQAGSVGELYKQALRWSHQYDGLNVSVSDGPVIRAWPQCHRVHVFGAEPFVPGRELVIGDLWVTSDKGLASIAIYNGRKLWRRFLCDGEKEFRQILQFSGVIQRNLVLIAEDQAGGKAVSFALRCWKVATLAPVYCGDHVNDCGRGYLAAGPGMFRVHRYPEIFGGYTWDGGPIGVIPSVDFQIAYPRIKSDLGSEGMQQAYCQIPIIEFSDDQAMVCRSVADRLYDPAIPGGNAWHNYGPLVPIRLMDFTRRYTEWNQAPVRAQPVGWSAVPVREGAASCQFRLDLTFKADQTIEDMLLLHSVWTKTRPLLLAIGDAHGECRVIDLSTRQKQAEYPIPTGAWFGFWSPSVSNATLVVNRGEPIILKAPALHKGSTLIRFLPDLPSPQVKAGESHHYDFFSVNDPVDADWSGPERFLRVLRYLDQPEGLEVVHGKRLQAIGPVDLQAADHRVEVKLPRPERPIGMALPLRVHGLNPNWSAGFFQVQGHSSGYYSDGSNGYCALGFDWDGLVYGALYADQAPLTHVVIGHPVVCDRDALVIEAVPRSQPDGPLRWHVAVNNPTDAPIEATFQTAIQLPGLDLPAQTATIPSGGYLVLLR